MVCTSPISRYKVDQMEGIEQEPKSGGSQMSVGGV